MHAWRDFHVDADIDEGELGVDQWVDAHAADARLETARGGRLAVGRSSASPSDYPRRAVAAIAAPWYWHRSTPACSKALGMVVEKSAEEMCARLEKGTAVPDVVVVVLVVAV